MNRYAAHIARDACCWCIPMQTRVCTGIISHASISPGENRDSPCVRFVERAHHSTVTSHEGFVNAYRIVGKSCSKLSTYPQSHLPGSARHPRIRYGRHMGQHQISELTMTQSLAERRRDFVQRCVDESNLLRQRLLFGMTTSLALQSIPLPDRCDLDTTVLHTTSSTGGKRVRAKAATCVPHVWKCMEDESVVRIRSNVYALELRHTWAQLSSHVPLDDLVAMGESILAVGNSLAEFSEFLDRMPYFKGKPACRAALSLMMPGVRSPMESKAMLTLRRHGVPCPVPNYAVPGAVFESGVEMTLDLAWPEAKVAVEYDGDHHRTDRRQWRRDVDKRSYLRTRDWLITEITADNLSGETAAAEFAFRVARQLAERGVACDFRLVAMSVEELARSVRKGMR